MSVQSYCDLKIWQRAMTLVTYVYEQTKKFPKDELYGLTSQIRRCAVSVPSNIAEGSSKRSTKEFIRFLNISYGSLAELETQIQIATNLNYLPADIHFFTETAEIGKMINGLIRSLDKETTELWTLNSGL